MTAGFSIFLLCIFLISNLVVGFLKGRDVKTVRDYAVGNKTWGGISLAMTLLATLIGGGAVYGTAKGLASVGVVALFARLLISASHVFIAFLLTNQVFRFQYCITIGDFIGNVYGKVARCFSGLLAGVLCFMNTALGIEFIRFISSDIFGIDQMTSIIVGTVIISFYTAFGGMRSVVATDILQFLMILGTLFTLMWCVLVRTDSVLGIFQKMPDRLLSMASLTNRTFAAKLSILLFLNNSAPMFQRLLMAKDRETAKKMYLCSALGSMIVWVMLLFIVFGAISVLGDKLAGTYPLNFIILKLVPVKLIPFIGLGLLAVIFSTADSYLHSAGLCLSKDFLEPILKRDIKLVEVRYITFFCGFLSMIIVLWFNSLLHFESIFRFKDPILAVPVLYGFLGFKGSKRMFWISAWCGFTVCLTVGYIPNIKTFNILFGCFASLFAYFAVHIYENKGFKFIGNPIFPDRIKKTVLSDESLF